MQQKELGPASSGTRDLADDFDRHAGRLSAECDVWTHQELEAWARERIDAATVPEMCSIVQKWSEYIEVEGECGTEEEEQEREIWKTLLIARRILPKRLLCLVGTPPQLLDTPTLEAHNLHLLQNYLPAELLSVLRGLVAEGRVVGDAGLVTFIYDDLRAKIALTPPTYVGISIVKSRSLDARNSLVLRLGPFSIDTRALILVVLTGEVSISAVSTNQTSELIHRTQIVTRDFFGTPLPSRHLLLGVGGVFALTWNADRDDVYDFVAVRTTDRAEVVVYEFSGS